MNMGDSVAKLTWVANVFANYVGEGTRQLTRLNIRRKGDERERRRPNSELRQKLPVGRQGKPRACERGKPRACQGLR
jgi:hypothetical protein